MKGPIIQVDDREPATLTAELTYLGYKVENLLLKAGEVRFQDPAGSLLKQMELYIRLPV